MSLTYLNAAMIEQPTVLPYLSAQSFDALNVNTENLTVDNILQSTNILGDLTVLGGLTALSGVEFIGTIVATTSALSVVNIGQGPALYIEQGPTTNSVASFVGDNVELVRINNINPVLGLATLAVRKPTTGPSISAQGVTSLESLNTPYLVATVASISTLSIGALSSITIEDANIDTLEASTAVITTVSATNVNFPESGGYVFNNASVFGNLTIFGSIAALSGLNLIATTTSGTTALSVVNLGVGPALYVKQAAGLEGVSVFAGDDGTEILKIRNTQPGNDPGLTVTGTISSTGAVHSLNGNSNIWNNTTTTVQNNSATTWNYQGTDLKTLSSGWTNTTTTVQNNSGNWQAAYNIGTTYTTASSLFMRRFATNIGNNSLTAFTVTHNLGTRDVITSVYDNATYENIITSIANVTTNTVSLSFSAAPNNNAYRVVIIG